MSTLIPNRQLSKIREMNREELRLMRACEVFDGDESKDENYIYTHIPKNLFDGVVADSIRIGAERLGVNTNSIYPPEIEQPKKPFQCDQCSHPPFTTRIALEGHKRTHKKK